MEQDDEWPARLAASVGRQLAYYRARTSGEGKGGRMSAQALSDRCAALGHPIHRSVIAKLEKGIRPTISLAELLVLARAIGVTPVQLLFPIGLEELTEVLPGLTIGTWAAAKWFTGEQQFPTWDPDGNRWIVSSSDWEEAPAAVDLLRWHDRHLSNRGSALAEAAGARKASEIAKTEEERDAHQKRAAFADNNARVAEHQLRRTRAEMRQRGLHPPELTPDLSHIDGDLPAEEGRTDG